MRGKPKLRTQRLFLNHPSLNKLLVSLSPHETQPSKHICNQGLRGMNNLLKHILYRWVHELKTATTTHYATTKSQANLLELESLSLNLNGWVNFSIFTPPPPQMSKLFKQNHCCSLANIHKRDLTACSTASRLLWCLLYSMLSLSKSSFKNKYFPLEEETVLNVELILSSYCPTICVLNLCTVSIVKYFHVFEFWLQESISREGREKTKPP